MQVDFAIETLKRMERDGIASADVRPAVQEAFNEEVQRRLRGTVWNAGGCRSYYLDRNGSNSTIYPGRRSSCGGGCASSWATTRSRGGGAARGRRLLRRRPNPR